MLSFTVIYSFFFESTADHRVLPPSPTRPSSVPLLQGGDHVPRPGRLDRRVLGPVERPDGDVHGAKDTAVKPADRKRTRLNSSHLVISYAVFCLKKNKQCFASTYFRASSKGCHDA